ncbi:short chain dehydrogenase [Planoprotostelium fungivorum]|uniref:Short chain dehydrogenase n=1 Tax=Planoprotostelium fungivorum TaxID=1890364 RepID=A0A2P6N698_9EUKA|nr:short chain dehydrogenase [Planoprotostelium fungivorum]
MSSSANSTEQNIWLISVVNRGIGLVTELQKLAAKHNNLHIAKLTSGSSKRPNKWQLPSRSLTLLKQSGGLDYVIAKADRVPLGDVNEHFHVNVVSVLVSFQAILPLFLKRPTRVFQAVSSLAGSNVFAHQLFWHVVWISVEYAKDDLVTIRVHPGTVETDMSHKFLKRYEYWRSIAIKSDDGATILMAFAEKAMRESQGRERR